jgi:hypothetical protein
MTKDQAIQRIQVAISELRDYSCGWRFSRSGEEKAKLAPHLYWSCGPFPTLLACEDAKQDNSLPSRKYALLVGLGLNAILQDSLLETLHRGGRYGNRIVLPAWNPQQSDG